MLGLWQSSALRQFVFVFEEHVYFFVHPCDIWVPLHAVCATQHCGVTLDIYVAGEGVIIVLKYL